MHMQFFRVPIYVSLCAVLFIGHSNAFAQSGDQVIKRLKEKYDSIDALRAEFTQTMSSAYSSGEESFSGTLTLQGDKYRIETDTQTLVTDGSVTWIFNKAEKQVLINNKVDDETAFDINDFFFNYSERYSVTASQEEVISGQKHYLLRLKPKNQDSFYSQVTLWVRDSDTVITRLEVVDMNETTMLFSLRNIDLNPQISRSTFVFTPPDNAEVVDLRS